MDELRQFAETLEELVACYLAIKKQWATEAEAKRNKANKTFEHYLGLYRQCREFIYILPGLLFERFRIEELYSLWQEVSPKINKLLSYHKEVIESLRYFFDIAHKRDEEQLMLSTLKECTSKLFKAADKGITIEITPDAFLSPITIEDSGTFDILVNLLQLHHIYEYLIGRLKVLQKNKRLTKPKLSRFLDNFAIEPSDIAQKLGWLEVSNQVKEIEIAIKKAKKRVCVESSLRTREYAEGLIPLMNILQEFNCKILLLIYRFSIDKRLKAEAWLSSIKADTKGYAIDQFRYEAFSYRISRKNLDPIAVSEAVCKLWYSEFQELDEGSGGSKKKTWYEDYTLSYPWMESEESKIEFRNLVAMIRFAEWAGIGQFDTFFENKLKKYESYFRSLPFRWYDMGLRCLFLSCRSQFIVKHLRQALVDSVDGMRIMYKDGFTPWTGSHYNGDEYFVEHCLLDACHYLFAIVMLEKSDKDEYLDSQAIKLILTEQNISGWWPFSTNWRFIPCLQVTALAIQTLSLLKPRGWKLAVSRGVNWLWSQQPQDGLWTWEEEQQPSWFWPSPTVDWLTVLILDTIDLAEGKTNLTFKLPQAVAQTFIWPETVKEEETKQKETVKPLKRRRGRPRKPDAGEKAEKITELKATGRYSWKEIGKEVGMTAAAARQLHYRYNKKNIINTCK